MSGFENKKIHLEEDDNYNDLVDFLFSGREAAIDDEILTVSGSCFAKPINKNTFYFLNVKSIKYDLKEIGLLVYGDQNPISVKSRIENDGSRKRFVFATNNSSSYDFHVMHNAKQLFHGSNLIENISSDKVQSRKRKIQPEETIPDENNVFTLDETEVFVEREIGEPSSTSVTTSLSTTNPTLVDESKKDESWVIKTEIVRILDSYVLKDVKLIFETFGKIGNRHCPEECYLELFKLEKKILNNSDFKKIVDLTSKLYLMKADSIWRKLREMKKKQQSALQQQL